MNRRTLLRSLCTLAGAAAAGAAFASRAAGTPSPDPAADLLAQAYPDLEGRAQALSQWKGRPMLVNFWATWCAPCIKEMPELDALSRRYPRVQFVGLAIDTSPNVAKFVAKVPVSYPLLTAGMGSIGLMRSLGNGPGGLPFTVILAADGSIRKQILGPVDPSVLDELLTQLSG
jgi:thiol-disulfide isomerase/thioredoxin